MPRVVLLLLLTTLWRPAPGLVIVVLGLTGWMSIARLVYGEARAVMARPFVESAMALGAGRRRVIRRHILPNALTPVLAATALGVGNTIMLEAGLSFLGLGVQPPTPSWGNMIASGRDTLVNAPWVAAAPGIALVLVVVACTLLGDAVRDHLDPGLSPAITRTLIRPRGPATNGNPGPGPPAESPRPATRRPAPATPPGPAGRAARRPARRSPEAL